MSKTVDSLGNRVSAVVVHHKSYESVSETVGLIIAAGVDPRRVLVVDNGEETSKRPQLMASIPHGVQVRFVENRGYGAAVNAAVAEFQADSVSSEYVLVSTHECRPSPQAVHMLVTALDNDADAAVAGPTLVTGDEESEIWSAGGFLTPVLNIPRHFLHRELSIPAEFLDPVARDWLDGAFLLYRSEALVDRPIDEDYFMYMEEVDHHVAMRESGRRVLWVPQARVWQSSGGIPPYYLARNMQLFQNRHGSAISRIAATPWSIFYRAASNLANRRPAVGLFAMVRGWRDAAGVQRRRRGVVVIVNPLGSALGHYQLELSDVLSAADIDAVTKSFDEPSASRGSRVGWIWTYIQAVTSARWVRNSVATVVLWPPLGYIDALLLRVLGGPRAYAVMHDPVPLVRAVGFDRVSKLMARMIRPSRFLAHSRAAESAVLKATGKKVSLLPHPILEPSRNTSSTGSVKVVRVLGQYKPDRDLEVLSGMAASPVLRRVEFEILGRGWPAVPGWKVVDRFLSETDFDHAIRTADVVVIPYRRFFQSGVAIRCLEHNTIFVGPGGTSLDELVGSDQRTLVQTSDVAEWCRAIAHALKGDLDNTRTAGLARSKAVSEWSRWVGALR